MSAETEIYAKLTATAGVTNLCGTRVYPLSAAQDAVYPYVVYDLVQSDYVACSAGQVGFSHRTYGIDCVDDTLSGASSLAAAVSAALEGYTGTAIKHCSLRDQQTEWVPLSDAENVGAYVIVQDWYVRVTN